MEEVKEKPAAQREMEKFTEKQKAKLDQWAYDATKTHLTGIVYDHPKKQDGSLIVTSRIKWVDETLKLAETRNTVYILLEKALDAI